MMTEKDSIIRSWSWNYGICQLKNLQNTMIWLWMHMSLNGRTHSTYPSKCDYGGRE